MEREEVLLIMKKLLICELWQFSLDNSRYKETEEALEWLESKENQELVFDWDAVLPKRIKLARTFAYDEDRRSRYVFPDFIEL